MIIMDEFPSWQAVQKNKFLDFPIFEKRNDSKNYYCDYHVNVLDSAIHVDGSLYLLTEQKPTSLMHHPDIHIGIWRLTGGLTNRHTWAGAWWLCPINGNDYVGHFFRESDSNDLDRMDKIFQDLLGENNE